jgi:hypothetical protein
MRYSHVHSTLDILLRLLRELTLVSKVLCILETICHAHDLGTAIILLSIPIIGWWMADSLELRPIVHSVDLNRRGYQLLGLLLWPFLRGGHCLLLNFLTTVIHFLLYLGIILVF